MDTFVVRVYRSGQDILSDDDRLRGVVEEISTGFRVTFHDTKELLSVLHRRQREKPGVPPRGSEASRAIARTLPDALSGGVHLHSQPVSTEGGGHEPGQRQT